MVTSVAKCGAPLVSLAAAGAFLSGCGGAPSVDGATPSQVTTRSSTAFSNRAPSYFYVANTATASAAGQRIEIFDQNHPQSGPVDSIRRGISQPDGIFIDPAGTLYVANADESGNDNVTAYRRGAHKPSHTYSGAVCAFDAVASSSTVYVADACGVGGVGRVIEYALGSGKPLGYLYPGGSPYCLAIDARGGLCVGYNATGTYAGQVKRYERGARRGEKLIPPNYAYFVTGV